MSLDLYVLTNLIKKSVVKIICITVIITIIATFFIIKEPNKYRSEITLLPVSAESSTKLNSSIGGLAALAGISLGGSSVDKVSVSIEMMKSRDFIHEFLKNNRLIPTIFAGINWDREKNKIVYDKELYNEENLKWVPEKFPFSNGEPSVNDVYKKFSSYISITKEKDTGIVRVQFDYFSPYIAQIVLKNLVSEVNDKMKEIEITEARKTIKYLENEYSSNQNVEMKNMLISLIAEQHKRIMLANIKDEYVFQTIDSAQLPTNKISPNRAVMLFLSVFFGFAISIIYVILSAFISESNKKTI